MTWQDLYGPQGWCVAAQPNTSREVFCTLDGLRGRHCDELVEHFCINQCSGRGVCHLGFCYCDQGEAV